MRSLLLVVLLPYAAVAAAVALFGEVHVDEGHYHTVGRLVLEGKLPYRDFIYVQAPVYPYVAALLQLATGSSFTAVRIGHALLGCAAVLLAGLLARPGGWRATLLFAALVVPNLFTVYHLTFIKLYPVTALFLTGALVAYAREGTAWKSLAFVLAALATGTRISVAPLLAVLAVAGALVHGRRIALPLLAGAATLAATFAPFLLLAREQLVYDMLTYHGEKDAFTTAQVLVYKADALSGIASRFWPAILLAVAAAWAAPSVTGVRAWTERLLPAAVVLALLASHGIAKGPNAHLYLTIVFPYAAAVVAAAAAPLFGRLGPLERPALVATLAAFALVLPAQVRETLALRMPPAAVRVDQVADDVASLTKEGDRIVSFLDSVPVAAGRKNLERYEMNAVTYDPSWDLETCRRRAILCAEELVAAIEGGTVTACLVTDDSFIGNFPRFYNPGERGIRPDVMAAIARHFDLVRTYPGFGYFGRDAYLYVRRSR